MSRSLKKGPFINEKLLKAIDDMNAANEKKSLIDKLYGGLNMSWSKVILLYAGDIH